METREAIISTRRDRADDQAAGLKVEGPIQGGKELWDRKLLCRIKPFTK